MNKNNKYDLLVALYPDMFEANGKKASLRPECNEGWYYILKHLCGRLKEIETKYDVSIKFTQIKEKWGILRIYYRTTFNDTSWTTVNGVLLFNGASTLQVSRSGWYSASCLNKANIVVEDLISEALYVAEETSMYVCEICGVTGATLNTSGWRQTLCSGCREDLKESRKIGQT